MLLILKMKIQGRSFLFTFIFLNYFLKKYLNDPFWLWKMVWKLITLLHKRGIEVFEFSSGHSQEKMRILRETGSRKNGLWKGVRINSKKQRLKDRNGVVNICFACLTSLLCLLSSPTGYMILMQPFRKILYPYPLLPLLLLSSTHTAHYRLTQTIVTSNWSKL